MSAPFSLLRDTRHLQLLAIVLLVAGSLAIVIRNRIVPQDFGERGPYPSRALADNAALPHFLSSDASCLKCHESVHEERKDSPHVAVLCMHCHGNGREHIAQAIKAATSPDLKIPAAQPWDGDFLTKIDLFITKDRAICLSCHQKVVGMPAGFRAIDAASHLEEQGASDAESPEACFECHTGHSPGI
jgi:hypothetical protein